MTIQRPRAVAKSRPAPAGWTRVRMARDLGQEDVGIVSLQRKFGLPHLDRYSEAYRNFLQKIIWLRRLGVPEGDLLELWNEERKLLDALRTQTAADSPTWFLDACSQKGSRRRRLLLSHVDLGVDLSGARLQLGLDFAGRPPELFAGRAMGVNELEILKGCLHLTAGILHRARGVVPHVRAAAAWASRLPIPEVGRPA